MNLHADLNLKAEGKQTICKGLTEMNDTGTKVKWEQCQSRLADFKGIYGAHNILISISGFGIDPETGLITADDAVWDKLLTSGQHKHAAKLRYAPCPYLNICHTIFANKLATGKHAKTTKQRELQAATAKLRAENEALMAEAARDLAPASTTPTLTLVDARTETIEAGMAADEDNVAGGGNKKRKQQAVAPEPLPSRTPKGARFGSASVMAQGMTTAMAQLAPNRHAFDASFILSKLEFVSSSNLIRIANKRFIEHLWEAIAFVNGDEKYHKEWLIQLADDNNIDDEELHIEGYC
jgi:hypothetical protein